jgi:hypothetical protein
MRQILVDHARSRDAGKRGSGQPVFSPDESMDAAIERPVALIAVDDALGALERVDAQKARLIEMRFFGGPVRRHAPPHGGPPGNIWRCRNTKVRQKRQITNPPPWQLNW